MKTFTHIACLLIGIGIGFVPGTWKGQLMAAQANALGISPEYVANTALPEERTRAKIVVGR